MAFIFAKRSPALKPGFFVRFRRLVSDVRRFPSRLRYDASALTEGRKTDRSVLPKVLSNEVLYGV